MVYAEHWSKSRVEKLMDISTTLSDYTQSLDLCGKIAGYLTTVLDLEPISLALVQQIGSADPKIVLLSSSGHVATGEGAPFFRQHILDIHQQTCPPTNTPGLRLANGAGHSEAGFAELEVHGFAMFPRAMVFARTIDASHRMCLIIHQRPDQMALSEGVADTLLMIAGQLSKLLRCLFAAADHPEVLGGPFDRLTGREWIVLRGLNSEDGEKQLADRLGLSPHTLHSHIKSIYRKLGVQGRLPLLLRLNEAQRDLRIATMNAHPVGYGVEHEQRAVAVG